LRRRPISPGGSATWSAPPARCRSNRQIASEMQLSVRTVESHLQRAYEKLGISGRHGLAGALRDQATS
jgi:DNA-binding CsgD family transcriptional regulator